MADKSLGPLTFGFDIGIASVGWCVLGESRIVDLGVRCFDKAETPDKGESLNKARRDARLMRRRVRRRAWRLTKLARMLKREGLIADVSVLKQAPGKGHKIPNLWELRVKALDDRLDAEEWARVIYHLVKHRGFHWISRAEEKAAEADKKEGGPVKKALSANRRQMAEKNYRTAAEMVLGEFVKQQIDKSGNPVLDKYQKTIPGGAARNKQGDYGKALARALLADELALLFEQQRASGNPYAGEAMQAEVLELFWVQKPPLSRKEMLDRIGRCTFEKAELRAPKASFTAERQVWLTRLNNLKIVVDGVTRRLNKEEQSVALRLPYMQKGEFTYKQLHAALTGAGMLPESFTFAGLRGTKDKDPLTETLIKLPAWQELHKTLEKAKLETEWKSMAGAATGGDPTLLDDIGSVLTICKRDDEAAAELRKLPLPNIEEMIPALLDFPRTSFKAFHALSLKALRKIVPHMESCLRYDEACIEAGYHHSQPGKSDEEKELYLPPLYEHVRSANPGQEGRMVFSGRIDSEITGGIPRNPVVLRALNQARKVANALIRKHGSPAAVHIEMARDLSRPQYGHWTDNGKYIEGRRDVETKQKEYRDQNERDKATFAGEHGIAAKSREFEKFQLYREQQGKCAYSLKPLDLYRVLHDIGYAEVDHALPYSRSYDDSKNNKTLVFTKENRDKGNRTPYEYLTSFEGGVDGERWREFVAFVEATYPAKTRNAKKSRLLRKNFGKDEAKEFRERNLNDTRYICKFFKSYVDRYLKFAPKVGAGEPAGMSDERCVVLSGQLTAFLRTRWGLIKVREENDRHHALDAAVIAACSRSMVQALSNYSRRRELDAVANGYRDAETGEVLDIAAVHRLEKRFPEPWSHFRHELCARLNIDDPAELREAIVELAGTYPPEVLDTVGPLFVSRAPQRRNSGAAHKDTIYGQPERLKAQGGVTQKVPLTSLKLTDLGQVGNEAETCKLIDWHRNRKLYEAIRARLDEHGGKGDKAFPPSNPLRKPDRDGNPTGPVVRTVTKVIDKLSGIPVRGGVAKNDSMLRVDVFTKAGKFHLVPVYVHHAVAKELPNRAIVAHKDEDDWTILDESFQFCFSLYPNDLTAITLKGERHLGYYAGCDRNAGAVNLWAHDRSQHVGKDGLIRGIGVKTALAFEKFHVDVLGNIYPAPLELSRGLA